MKTKLFNIAHAIKAKYTSFAEALKAAWKVIKLSSSMKKGVVSFAFVKVDGSIRKALGTLKNTPATTGNRAVNNTIFTYFDIESDGWRSAKIENIIF